MMTKKLIVFFVLFLYLGNFCTSGQTSDCQIYNKILISLNSKWASSKMVDTGVVDPENSTSQSIIYSSKNGIDFFIVKQEFNLDKYSLESWVAKALKDSTILKKNYTRTADSLFNCRLSPNLRCHIIESDDDSTFSKQIHRKISVNGVSIRYTPIRIAFSNILYIEKSRAVVYANAKVENGELMFIYILKRVKNTWQINKKVIEMK